MSRIEGGAQAVGLVRIIVAALLMAIFASVWYSHISGALIEKDGAENLQLALNLEHFHIYSNDSHAPYYPSNTREPVPVLTMALAVRLVDAFMGPADSSAYFQGKRARYIKLQSAVWMAALCAVTFFAAWSLTRSFYGSLLCVVLLNKLPLLPFNPIYHQFLIDSLYTEIPAATLLLLASILTVLGFKRKNSGLIVLAGIAFGALALTKGAALYVFGGFVLVGLILCWINQRYEVAKHLSVPRLLMLTVGCLAVVLPWLIRNHAQVGTWQIAGRGGIALHQRAVNNDMTGAELRATLYWWAPDPVTRWIFGHTLHLSNDDFIHRDSPYRRLSRDEGSDFYEDDYAAFRAGRPDDAISFYLKSYAEERQYQHKLEAQGVPNADLVTDRVFGDRGMALMKAHPGMQLIETPLFLYRAAAYLSLLLLAVMVYAWRRRQSDLLLLVLPSILMLGFYALLTDYIFRYAVPLLPLAVVAVVATVQRAFFGAAGADTVGLGLAQARKGGQRQRIQRQGEQDRCVKAEQHADHDAEQTTDDSE